MLLEMTKIEEKITRNLSEALWTAEDILSALELKQPLASFDAYGVSIDSRTIKPGEIFIAIHGEHLDGHNYVTDAISKGASAVIIEKKIEELPENVTVIQVKDTFDALRKLANYQRIHLKGKCIAITGSVGKTSVKEGVFALLKAQKNCYASKGNFNNHFGLPLSLANMPRNVDYGIFELGMNHAGEISHLTQMVRPHVAVINSVEAVHLEFFSSVAGIADAKAEIMEGLVPGGTVVLPIDNAYFDRLLEHSRRYKAGKVITFGASQGADVRLIRADLNSEGQNIEVSIAGKTYHYQLKLFGEHHVMNSVAMLAACFAAGEEIEKIILQCSGLEAVKGRGKIFAKAVNGGSVKIIDDSYNASPASMRAALRLLSRMNEGREGRTIAVLGDMLELGKDELQFHQELAKDIATQNIQHVFTSGSRMESLYAVLPKETRVVHAMQPKELLEPLKKFLRNGDLVLMKGSNGSRIWQLAELLLDA